MAELNITTAHNDMVTVRASQTHSRAVIYMSGAVVEHRADALPQWWNPRLWYLLRRRQVLHIPFR